ncbi:MAG: hypothetical protein IJ229_04835, partial [Clostridia bacterium]|nr:hypothetical protein [Clostridia bacterium]
PEAEKPDALEMARFRRLAGIDSLRLLCFATPECIRTVLFSHPNTLAWKTEHDMPLHGNGSAEDNRRFSVLNRFFLLARAQEKSMDHTHYAWMDFAYLRYPVYEGATLHWDAIAGQKICIGTCEGKMDLSMIVVPAGEVLPLTREISAMCEKHWKEKGCLPEPEDVLWTLAERSSGRFDFVPIPTRGDLFSLTMTLFGEEWGIKRK